MAFFYQAELEKHNRVSILVWLKVYLTRNLIRTPQFSLRLECRLLVTDRPFERASKSLKKDAEDLI